ncbi:hypothetical protein BDN72DRAFT_906827 [Pluteus cervinus]|uniref:Uncharacterized protein n=1 Tax=Pluteus cervinus TaxID=181527 RepID=A0ACD2ZYI1_9AGAR|nr:hypothetical protein BDN72DRAFT_906827 [Pluteus cervinus]
MPSGMKSQTRENGSQLIGWRLGLLVLIVLAGLRHPPLYVLLTPLPERSTATQSDDVTPRPPIVALPFSSLFPRYARRRITQDLRLIFGMLSLLVYFIFLFLPKFSTPSLNNDRDLHSPRWNRDHYVVHQRQ